MLELDKADMANAAILLGLLPVFVAAFGPDVKEISLLSSRRPLLSLLLSIGVPAVYVSRPMEYADPLELLEPSLGRFTVGRVEDGRLATVISGAEYGVVVLAIINLLWVSYTLGLRTVLAWKCIAFMPLAWVLVPVIVHLLAAVTFKTSNVMRHSEKMDGGTEEVKAGVLRSWVRTEFLICANQRETVLKDQAPGFVTVALNIAATLMGSIHVIFGIVVFASLLFISLLDATLVCVRYVASILVCRFVLKFEIAGARGTFRLEKSNAQYQAIDRKDSSGFLNITYSHQRSPSLAEKQTARTYSVLI